jgi:hypothetical protein
MFPELQWLWSKIRPWTAIGRAETPLIQGLNGVLDERKKNFNVRRTKWIETTPLF